jgi:flavin reductase (DIM6/NTAB) family NADH-FMN oxidoreductase RutF
MQSTRRSYVFPDPVVLVTVDDGRGGANIITLAWVGMACSDPVCVSIAVRPSRYSHGLLKASGEFTVNIPGAELLTAVDHCGIVSGRDHDKWSEAGLTPAPAEHVGAPRIAECAYALECRVVHSVVLGAHELFVGEVLGAYADERVLDEDGRLDYEALSPIAYLPDAYHGLGHRIGTYGKVAEHSGPRG